MGQERLQHSTYQQVEYLFEFVVKRVEKCIGDSNKIFFFRVVFKPLQSILGGRMKYLLCGGAPLSPETHELIKNCLCATVLQGYALTETSSCATVMDSKLVWFTSLHF